MANIIALIPAAGSSSRMGVPKQLLKWKNTTLLGHAIASSQAIPVSKTVVVLGANFDRIFNEIKHLDIHVLENKDWQDGLGKSIATGVSFVRRNIPDCEGILILLPDQPTIETAYLKSLFDTFMPGTGQIIATSYNNGNRGVPALFDKMYFNELAVLKDDKGAKSILNTYTEHVEVLNAGHVISDIDTLEDYERLSDERP